MESIVFYDVRQEPFSIYGLYEPHREGLFRRLPADVAEATSKNVAILATETSGGRIRFATDSDTVVIRAKGSGEQSPHLTSVNRHGFDLYIDRPNGSVLADSTKHEPENCADFEYTVNLKTREMRELTLYMPLYGEVRELRIGLREGAALEKHSPYCHENPIVFYGSSITQGACASRPGRSYQAMIERRYNTNFINLGFSASAKGEDAIVKYMATLEMAAFVSDYDHNAPDPEHLRRTHYPLYERIRAKNPTIPYFMLTRPDFRLSNDSVDRRVIVMESYLRAWNAGDRNVYFIDGSAFFNGEPLNELTVDRCHPNDEGLGRMARYIGDVLAKVMDL